jgi:hypothetical protein
MTDYKLPAAVRRRLAMNRQQTISRRDTGGRAPGANEKCKMCREPYPLGVLERGLCSMCHADLAVGDADQEDMLRYGLRRDGFIRGTRIA